MFTSILWLSAIFMIATLVAVPLKLFKGMQTFSFSEHKKTVVSLILMAIIAIITFTENIFTFIRFSGQAEMGNISFSGLAFLAFVCAFYTLLPNFYPSSGNQEGSASFARVFYNIFFSVAIFFEVFATLVFYVSWTHS